MKKTLGGDRLGSGKRMKVDLHGYERSTHDLGYLWRSTMSAGTLVPFMSEVALPGDTFDINLDVDVKTHPTIGPLFGSFKVQIDVFQAPFRLYQGQLHNNKLGIGMVMSQVKLPIINLISNAITEEEGMDIDNTQINPSCILAYLGMRGVGLNMTGDTNQPRAFNAVPFLAYWDIYKNYYSNKQEEIGAVVHNAPATGGAASGVTWSGSTMPLFPTTGVFASAVDTVIEIPYAGTAPNPDAILILEQSPFGGGSAGIWRTFRELVGNAITDDGPGLVGLYGTYNYPALGLRYFRAWRTAAATDLPNLPPTVVTFPLENIDVMREEILAAAVIDNTAFNVNSQALEPYSLVLGGAGTQRNMMGTQEGLGLKTYQSDLFNNWLSTEWIDGTNGINEITAVDTSGGSFQIDTLNLSRKVYDMLNRIAVSGGTYDDWLDAVYTHDRYTRCETPMYMGGLIKELIFQEVVSNSEAGGGDDGGTQPLGTLAGKGVLGKKHKGGHVTVKVDEPSYIIGIISLTPRLDYSQGNKWDTHLLTMDDLHKPALDEIGFQELITEQMAWWETRWMEPGQWETRSAGKQPAWMNYMTNVNRTLGNFAIRDNEMFMTLNRRYEPEENWVDGIKDLTTYIDPVKFNQIFAETTLDAQNFWTQIAVDITARRKMSAKIMPNL